MELHGRKANVLSNFVADIREYARYDGSVPGVGDVVVSRDGYRGGRGRGRGRQGRDGERMEYEGVETRGWCCAESPSQYCVLDHYSRRLGGRLALQRVSQQPSLCARGRAQRTWWVGGRRSTRGWGRVHERGGRGAGESRAVYESLKVWV